MYLSIVIIEYNIIIPQQYIKYIRGIVSLHRYCHLHTNIKFIECTQGYRGRNLQCFKDRIYLNSQTR